MEDAIQFKIAVSKEEKMIEAFQNIQGLKQLKIVKVVPEINQTSVKATVFAIFSSRLTCKFEINLNTHSVNTEPNLFLKQLANSENIG